MSSDHVLEPSFKILSNTQPDCCGSCTQPNCCARLGHPMAQTPTQLSDGILPPVLEVQRPDQPGGSSANVSPDQSPYPLLKTIPYLIKVRYLSLKESIKKNQCSVMPAVLN